MVFRFGHVTLKTVSIENVFDSCVSNEWFNNPEQANEYFKKTKAMCY